jgi:hypothetical protein
MPRRPDRHLSDAAPDTSSRQDAAVDEPGNDTRPDLSALPVVGITPRRLAGMLGVVVAAWILIAFARQAGVAAEASARAQELRLSNVQLASDVEAIQRELELIQRPQYIAIEMRAYRLGRAREIPFTLAPGAPPLGPNAPGSAAARIGEQAPRVTPLESWLSLLFGPSR